MLIKLIASFLFIFQINAFASAPSELELRSFAHSKQWLRLYVYRKSSFGKYSTKATEQKFFFSKEGKTSPIKELKAAILAFKDHKKLWGHQKLPARCTFPARFEIIKRKWPKLFTKTYLCPKLSTWIEKVAAKKVYLSYAGPYPNNAASMFGHSFIRFSREKNTPLTDYIVGFRAIVDPRDNPIYYTVKGIAGGYNGFYNMKPFYINVGLYNNAESRSLWEYELALNANEQKLLLYHIWELMFNTGFPYYFLDENCSYYLLTILETIKPSWNLTVDPGIFVHPIETIKAALDEAGEEYPPVFRKDIKSQILIDLENLNNSQRDLFYQAIDNVKLTKQLKDKNVLDLLVKHWKFENYKANTKLSPAKKALLNATYMTRAALKEKSAKRVYTSKVSPRKIHKPSKISYGYALKDKVNGMFINYKMGHHGLGDDEEGMSRWSFIDFFGAELIYEDHRIKLNEVSIVDIRSLENFHRNFKEMSWTVDAKISRDCFYCFNDLSFQLKGGIGPSVSNEYAILWAYALAKLIKHKETEILTPSLEIGGKLKYRALNLAFQSEGFYRDGQVIVDNEFIQNFKLERNLSILLTQKYRHNDHQYEVRGGIKFHF